MLGRQRTVQIHYRPLSSNPQSLRSPKKRSPTLFAWTHLLRFCVQISKRRNLAQEKLLCAKEKLATLCISSTSENAKFLSMHFTMKSLNKPVILLRKMKQNT